MLIAVRCALAVFVSRHDIVNHLISSLLQDCQVFSLFLIAALSLRDPSLSKIAEKLHMQWRIIRSANPADHSATIHSYVEEKIRVPTQWISHGLQVRAVVLLSVHSSPLLLLVLLLLHLLLLCSSYISYYRCKLHIVYKAAKRTFELARVLFATTTRSE